MRQHWKALLAVLQHKFHMAPKWLVHPRLKDIHFFHAHVQAVGHLPFTSGYGCKAPGSLRIALPRKGADGGGVGTQIRSPCLGKREENGGFPFGL